MFDIGFWEMAVIGVIALMVIGPERLPAVARNVGRWVGTARRYVSHVKSDIERELHADEMRELLEQPEGLESIRDVARDTAAVFEDTRKEINSIASDAANDVTTDVSGDVEGEIKQQASIDAVDDAAGDSAVDDNAERRVPHHAVDDDPFSSSSDDSNSDSLAESLSETSAPSSTEPSADQGDTATTSDSATNEQRIGQPGQR